VTWGRYLSDAGVVGGQTVFPEVRNKTAEAAHGGKSLDELVAGTEAEAMFAGKQGDG
jgi:hypothetical protein